MLRNLTCLALLAAAAATACAGEAGSEEEMDKIAEMYAQARTAFPEVPDISPAELLRELPEDRYVLVDVREPHEQAVSRIPGALTVDEFAARRDELRDREVVTYCTIGARSGRFAAELLRDGWEARNLAGAILGWTHVGGPLVDGDGEPTRRVHVFGRRWSLAAEGYEEVW